jgi:immune inhibitor A
MKKKLLAICLVVILVVTAVGVVSAVRINPVDNAVKRVQSLAMFSAPKWSVHYRAPNTDQIGTLLEEQGIPLGSQEVRDAAIQAFQSEWAKRNPTTPNPQKFQELLARERGGISPASVAAEPQIMSLAVPVEFPNSDTFTWCGDTVTQVGPLHNEIPAPGARDNNTVWYDNTTPALYNSLYFGVGPKAGVIVHHPNLGTLDFRGNTMANYYLEQSEGKFVPKGEVYPKWLQALHSEGWYGADSCDASNHNVLAGDLVAEVVDAIKVDNPNFAWETYDGDGDGIVDNFTVLHAGMGQEAGGGAQADFSIWSHASAISYPTGKLACTAPAAGCPDRNIYVREYSMDPENLDVGVISEEYGHAAFGLPDIYTTDAQASPANWIIMEAGSWNGKLGGMQPAPFPLWFKYSVGWVSPVELDYTTAATKIKVGQLSQRPANTEQGVKINLPNTQVVVPNRAGTGKAWWSTKSDLADFTLAHTFDLTGTTAPIFSFDTYWSFETGYDYGYFEVSDNGGTTWTKLKDTTGFMVLDTGVGGTNYALNDIGTGNIKFDLTAYVGKTITLRLHDVSDVGVQYDGWWADNFQLADGATVKFTDDVENPPNGWTTNAFQIVPQSNSYPMYYLVEWRNLSGFDKGLIYPYTTLFSDEDEWQVDRCPYSVPGMLLWLRNAAQDFDYTLYNSINDSPSVGPKGPLLVVDSHYFPMEWNTKYSTGAGMRLNSRCQPGNATFTVPSQGTKSFTARRSDATGAILETKTFPSLPAVSQFHYSLGYYPGYYYPGTGAYIYYWDKPASLVVPATGDYSTRITNLDKTPDLADYGFGLGTGNPRDDGVQYGLNIAVLDKALNGSWGKIVVWNAKSLGSLEMKVNLAEVTPGQTLKYQIKVTNTSPARQSFTVTNAIPANTKFQKGPGYHADSNSIIWTGVLKPNQTKVINFWVKVNAGVPASTVITNMATLADDTSGDDAQITSTVK